jgi:septum site-determining protein MinC
MKEAVFIKSFPNGIALHVDPEMPFLQLIDEIEKKFEQAKDFFGKASIALSIEGRVLSEEEEDAILNVIKKNTRLNILCLIKKDSETNDQFVKALETVESKLFGRDDGQFFKGSLTDGDVVETDKSIIILGDVCLGSAVISSKNIIILGSLYGEAYAGGNGAKNAFIAALEMAPERIKIGDFKYKRAAKQSKWKKNTKPIPQIAFVKNEEITFEPLTKEKLDLF